MSNLIFACWRKPSDALDSATLRGIADRMTPKVLKHHPHLVAMGAMDCLCLTGPVGPAKAQGTSAHLGAFAGPSETWHIPGTAIPEGTFALVRSDDQKVELCSDFAGTRTLWYVHTDTCFFASTSQRALVALLGDFELNKAALGWFISSGSLGPTDSWDSRITRLPANAHLVLDRMNWALELHTHSIAFSPRPMKAAACKNELARVLHEAILSYDFGSDSWVLPLSGGVDSRCILMTLYQGGTSLPTVTWGMESSLGQVGNDAFIAKQLTDQLGLRHDYLLTEDSHASPGEVVDRFLAASGGTTDQLPGYLDGLRLWSSLVERGVTGVIRGDAGFNGDPVCTVQQARTSSTMVLLSDFMDAETAEAISDGKQSIPHDFQHDGQETNACYRDRIYHMFRIPVGLAALNDVKAPFVEIANPLLSQRVLDFIRQMPDANRANRITYEQIVREMNPTVPFATMQADDNTGDFRWSLPYSRWMNEELESETAIHLFPATFRQELISHLQNAHPSLGSSRSFRAAVKRIIPPTWIRAVRVRMGNLPEVPGLRQVALRAALASHTIRIYQADATNGAGRQG